MAQTEWPDTDCEFCLDRERRRRAAECKCDRCDRPIREFIQMDAWANFPEGDSLMRPDADGDVLMWGSVSEPQRSGTTVRIQVAAGTDLATLKRILEKQMCNLARQLECDADLEALEARP